MPSIHTNSASLNAISVLRSHELDEQRMMGSISSGLRIRTASENPQYWSVATSMRAGKATLDTVHDMTALTVAEVDVAYQGMTAAIDLVTQIQLKLVAAREPGVDRGKLNTDISSLKSQIITVVRAASFSGENWLYNPNLTAIGVKNLVTSAEHTESGTLRVSTATFDTAGSVLIDAKLRSRGLLNGTLSVTQPNAAGTGSTSAGYYLINLNNATGLGGSEIKVDSTTAANNLAGMINATAIMLSRMTNTAATLGAISASATAQAEQTRIFSDILATGIGRLVDTDVNEASTRLKAIQAQKQLTIQSLSIANSNTQAILQLFR